MFEGQRGGEGGGALEGRPDDKKELTGDGGQRVDAEPAEEEVVDVTKRLTNGGKLILGKH